MKSNSSAPVIQLSFEQRLRRQMNALLTEDLDPEDAYVYEVLVDIQLSVGQEEFWQMFHRVMKARKIAEEQIKRSQPERRQ